MLSKVLIAAGIFLSTYGFFRLKAGDRVVVSTKDVEPKSVIDQEILVQVTSIERDVVTGKVLAKLTGVPLSVERIGFVVTFPKHAIRRRG